MFTRAMETLAARPCSGRVRMEDKPGEGTGRQWSVDSTGRAAWAVSVGPGAGPEARMDQEGSRWRPASLRGAFW
jgi:hypothetical protein